MSEHPRLRILIRTWSEIIQAQTGNPQALAIMDLIIQDLAKIDQFHHNYEMMTHGETTQHAKRDIYDTLLN